MKLLISLSPSALLFVSIVGICNYFNVHNIASILGVEGTQLRTRSAKNTRTALTALKEEERRTIDIPIGKKKFSEDQRTLLLNNFHNVVFKDGVNNESTNYKRTLFRRKLAEGDWEFLNTFFESLDLNATINETFEFKVFWRTVEFTVGEITCNQFRISDIVTEASGNDETQDLSFVVKGIQVNCELGYR